MMRVSVIVLAAAALGVCGCAATSGSAWVRQPDSGAFSVEAHDRVVGEPLVAESDNLPRARPRLASTITLGEIHATYPEHTSSAPSAERAPVSVTINNYVTTIPNGYYGTPFVAHHYGDGGARPHPAPRVAPTHPGQDWPAVPNHGTSFPFKTAPASPWR